MTDHLRTPLANALANLADQRAQNAQQLTGRGYPCSVVSVTGAFVTVNFEIKSPFTLPQVTMPVDMWSYLTLPVQVGDKGRAIPSDAYLGGVSGQGGGVADLSQRANLATLVFHPISNQSWSIDFPNDVTLTGVGANGVVLRCGDKSVTLHLTSSGVTLELNGGTLAISDGNVTITNGDLIVDTTSFKTHLHTGVQPGGGLSGPPEVGS